MTSFLTDVGNMGQAQGFTDSGYLNPWLCWCESFYTVYFLSQTIHDFRLEAIGLSRLGITVSKFSEVHRALM